MPDDYSQTVRTAAKRIKTGGAKIRLNANRIKAIAGHLDGHVKTGSPGPVNEHMPPGLGTYDGKPVALWIIPHLKYARNHGWNGSVSSGYRSKKEQIAACIHVCGNPNGCPGTCAKPGTSNHERKTWPGGAVDVTDYANFGRIVKGSPHSGRLINDLPDDPVHFSQTGH